MKNKNYIIDELLIDEIYAESRFDRFEDKNLKLEELAHDIKENGQNNEIWVNEEDAQYSLIAGSRRLQAMKLIGKKRIRAKIFKVEKIEASYMVCNENSNRLDYDNFERISNFVYLVHLENLKKNKNTMDERFVPMAYISAMTKIKNFVITDEGDKKRAKEEIMFKNTIKTVLEKSGLYSSLHAMYDKLPLLTASDKVKKFSTAYAIPTRGIIKISKIEEDFADNENLEAIMTDLFNSIKALDSKGQRGVIDVCNKIKRKYSAKTNQEKYREREFENARATHKNTRQKTDKLFKSKTLADADVRKLVRAINRYEKEIDSIITKQNKGN